MGDREEHYSIPQQASTLKKLLRVMKRSGQWNALVTEDGKGVRVFGKVEDTGSQVIQTKNDALDVWCEANLPEGSSWKVTGTAHLVDVNNASLASDMVGGLGLALIAVAIIAGLLFRSGAMVVLCLITNLLPLVMIAGVMVLMDVDLKVTSGIIFTVAFGIAVDDTIHFLSKLRLQLSPGPVASCGRQAEFFGHRQSHRGDQFDPLWWVHDAHLLVVLGNLPHRLPHQLDAAFRCGGRLDLPALDGASLV